MRSALCVEESRAGFEAGGSYQSLKVWQKGMDLAEAVYAVTQGFPKAEVYGLTSQLRRASVSVPSNIAEGYGRETDGSFAHFLRIAQGSLKEIETQVMLSVRIGYLSSDGGDRLLQSTDELGRMLRSFINTVSSRSPASTHYARKATH